MRYESMKKVLKKNRCRMTPQRKIVLDILLEHQNTLLTIDDLLEMCRRKNNRINITTIYRNIELLDNLGLLFKMNINRHTTAYKLICNNHDHHHHIICLCCGKVASIDYCPVTPSLAQLIQSKKFTLSDHHLALYGYCENCSELP